MAELRVRIWDLPTRVFHWLLAALVILSWLTGQFGGSDWRDLHFLSGYGVFALLLYRLIWGFTGPRYARFATFPPRVAAALRGWRLGDGYAGHTPLGAFSVYAMLGVSLLQVITGLFSTDDSFSEGPWARYVAESTVHWMTRVHAWNRWLLLVLVLLHLVAITYFVAVRRQNLIGAMLHGDRKECSASATDDSGAMRLRAAAIAALVGLLVGWLVSP